MDVFSIVLIIAGIIVIAFSGIIFASTSTALNKKNWPDFVSQVKEKGLHLTEDELYQMVNKINTNACLALIIGLIIVICGIMLKLLIK